MIVETPSDREFACFFCGEGKSKDISSACPNCGKPLDIGRQIEHQRVGDYTLEHYVNRGYYGATYYAENRIRKGFAVKITPRILYRHHEKDFEEEIQKYRQLESHPNIAELIDAGDSEIRIDSLTMPIYYVVTEWVEGQSLTEFIKREDFSVNEMYGIILDIFSGVARFESKNLWHNDLNSDNILVKQLTAEELETRRSESRFICKIVDLGSAVFRQSERKKILDDIKFVGEHINSMRAILLEKISSITKEDRYFLNELGKVVAHILDEDPSRSVVRAHAALDEVKALYARRLLLEEEGPVQLSDPLTYLNANELTEAHVGLLFSDQFPWLKSIIAPENQPMLITGPRGSGKTIILKSMRLKTKMNRQVVGESIEQIRNRVNVEKLAGFFVSARIDIGNNCPLTKLPEWAKKEEQVNLYFNLLYAYEIIDSIHQGMNRGLLDLPSNAERIICSFLCDNVSNGYAATFGGLLSSISVVQNQIILDKYTKTVNPGVIGPTFLGNISNLIKETIPFLQKKNFIFLLDDFSLPKVPEIIQRTLLPIIWNSGGGYSFRVTAHSESTVSQDLKGISYLPNREYTEVNLGASYINNMDEQTKLQELKRCIDDILGRRFALNPSFRDKSLVGIVGAGERIPIASRIKELEKKKKLQTLRYWGWVTIISLCSGDISYIIDILRQILREAPKEFPVTKDVQNREIRRYARTELYRLQEYAAVSCNLYEVAANFGKFSRFKLLKDQVGKEKRPGEYLRIEIQIDSLSVPAKEAIGDLLRYGVFVDGGFSSSAAGTPARRLIFKKLFTPVFPTTYNSRDTWPMSAAHFLEFITDPKKYVKKKLGEHGLTPEQQSFELDRLIQQHNSPLE